jgi:ketosteroid isomerase-like protein
MDRTGVPRWVAAYERAWRSAGTDPLSHLFTEDATYRTAPFEPPYVGLPAIAAMWEDGRESPDEVFDLASEVVAVEGNTAVVRLEISYGDPVEQTYRDLWVLRFAADGRCAMFEEWPFWPRGAPGGYHPGPG